MACAAIAVGAPAAGAEVPPFLAQTPEEATIGEAPGQLNLPRGVAADPGREGHVFVVDANNFRISEYTAWGEFVKAWGWEVDASDPQPELQTCTAATGCRKGGSGTGAGQFKSPEAIAVDGSGMVYVIDIQAGRVQRFDPSGGPGEDEAVLLKSFGEAGAGEGQLGGGTFAYLSRIAACPADDSLFVAEGERIQRFDSEGVFEGPAIATPAGKEVRAIATDPSCDLYVAYEGEAGVEKIAPGAPYEVLLPEFAPEDPAERPTALAVDGAGNLYVALSKNNYSKEPKRTSFEPARAQKYDSEGNCLTCGEEGEAETVLGEVEGLLKQKTIHRAFDRTQDGTELRSAAASGACDAGGEGENSYLGRSGGGFSYLNGYGIPDPAVCPPPLAPPVVEAQYAIEVEPGEAKIRADVNPRFWSGSVGTTRYYAQWGTTACIEEGGWGAECASEEPAAPGAVLGGEPTNSPVPTAALTLEGLAPGTSYSYRFVAESTGGGPVYGEAPEGGEASFEEGEGRIFLTPREGGAIPACANDAFRSGPGALLPDCRAYELVSPLDKEGGDIIALAEVTTGLPATLSQSAADGGRLAYGSYRAFAGSKAAPRNAQYIAKRIAGSEWISRGISPPEGEAIYTTAKRLDNEFRRFSEDLCTAWVQSFADPQLAPGAPEGFSDIYRRDDEECGGPSFTPLNTAVPSAKGPEFDIELQGTSADGLTAAFVADTLAAAGGTPGRLQLYGRRGAEQRMLCILPEDGGAIGGACTAGGSTVPVDSARSRMGNLQGAVSEDGERVFFTETANATGTSGIGEIYARERPFAAGEDCSGPEAPCTVAVSEEAEGLEGEEKSSLFQAAAADGSRALFTTKGTLYEYDLEAEETTEIAGEVVGGIVGASEDAREVYFVSREAKAPGATAGEANLYHRGAGGEYRLVGALEEGADLSVNAQSPVSPQPRLHTARASASGEWLALTATSPLTGYDNRDAQTGERDAEVFVYDAVAEELVCVSCRASGARPRGGVPSEGAEEIRSAARLPVYQNSLYGSRLLSLDGKRLFFLAQDALALKDTNGHEDLYQWEAVGKGGCSEAAASYSEANGGCVDLISSGQAPLDVRFLDADESGSNVFFTTVASLLPQDYGLADVYVARVGGGLPVPERAAPQCEGEACQSPPPPPEAANASSLSYRGPGNLKEAAGPRSRCAAPARRAKRLFRRARALRQAARRAARRGSPRVARRSARRARVLAKAARKQARSAKRCRARARANRRSQR